MTNREIKFRVWDGEQMRVLDQMFVGVGQIGFSDTHYVDLGGIDLIDYEHEPKSLVMQFTGLKDKNGIDIYEGDILKCERDYWDNPRNLVVEWNEDCWSLLRVDDPVDSEVMNHNSSFNVPSYEREVIGNIYEHGHLLEQEEEL